MPKEKSLDASVEAPAEPQVNAAPPATEEDSVDEQVKEILGDVPVSEEETPDETPEAKQPEKKEGEEAPGTEEAPADSKPAETPAETAPQAGRLDKRIAKLFLSNKLLTGEEGDLPSLEQVAIEIQGYPLKEKTEALHRLLAENKALRNGGQNDGVVDLSEEDHEAIVEAEVENRLQGMQTEIQEREWREDLIATVDAHPELDERKNEYNPKIAIAVEKLAKKGMKVSEALQLVTDSISSAKADEKKTAEINKQKILSGAVSASNESSEPKGAITWEDLAKMQVEDPDRYMKLVKDGKLPKE